MKQEILVGIVAMGLFGAMQAASAQSAGTIRSLPQQGAWSVTPEFGAELSDNGSFISAGSFRQSAAGTLWGSTINAAVTLSTDARDFKDVYKDAYSLGASFNYGLNEATEVFGRVRYTEAKAKEFNALTANATVTWGGATITANGTAQGKLSDYSSWGLEVGSRYFFSTKDAFKPYVSPSLGFTQVDKINVEYVRFNGTNLFSSPIRMYKSSWAYNLGVTVGFRYDLSKTTAIGVETGYRYQDKLKADDTDLGSYGANRSGKRGYIPLTVGVNIAF